MYLKKDKIIQHMFWPFVLIWPINSSGQKNCILTWIKRRHKNHNLLHPFFFFVSSASTLESVLISSTDCKSSSVSSWMSGLEVVGDVGKRDLAAGWAAVRTGTERVVAGRRVGGVVFTGDGFVGSVTFCSFGSSSSSGLMSITSESGVVTVWIRLVVTAALVGGWVAGSDFVVRGRAVVWTTVVGIVDGAVVILRWVGEAEVGGAAVASSSVSSISSTSASNESFCSVSWSAICLVVGCCDSSLTAGFVDGCIASGVGNGGLEVDLRTSVVGFGGAVVGFGATVVGFGSNVVGLRASVVGWGAVVVDLGANVACSVVWATVAEVGNFFITTPDRREPGEDEMQEHRHPETQ